jgi:aminoglycoside 6'-N-acetyltransferase I
MDFANAALREQAAALLVEGFRANWPEAWPTIESAREEVAAFETDERICRVALDEQGQLLGWIGGLPTYALVWELHPLVVALRSQGLGIGRALVRDLEARVGARGGLTIMLGSDDESGQTTISGLDLYPNVCAHIAGIRNLRRHPYEFYQKLGFTIVGMVPDANGYGKPDILMAKRVQPLEIRK